MTTGILDTTVVIHYFRALPAARAWIDSMPNKLYITSITYLEVLDGVQNQSVLAANLAILDQFTLIHLTITDQDWAIEQMKRIAPQKTGTSFSDVLIAAVAYRLQIPLFTDNERHMRVLLPKHLVIKPY